MQRATEIDTNALAARLRRETTAEILFGAADRGRYATDASIYQVMPLGVVVPKNIEDVAASIAIARAAGAPVLARGAGTSQCGQTVNRAVVLDCSKHLRRVLAVDPQRRTATVEPGLVLAHLNAALRREKLFFPVDPSTHARCTIGGMTGNNSCGAKSIRYGLMADNVLSIDAILADGTQHRFGVEEGTSSPRIADLVGRLRVLGAAEAKEIAEKFPKVLRRVGGYNLDALVPGAVNFSRLLVGSEGTLAFSAAIELKLSPVKPRKVLGICQFPTFREAMRATQTLVALDPEAVELVDRTMIELGRTIPIYRATLEEMLIGEPGSLLIVEFHGESDGPLLAKLDELNAAMADLGHPGAVVRATDEKFQARIAAVREAGLNIMMSMKGDAKPVSFIEDCAVPLADLADYTERLEAVFARHGVKGTWYAHASVGCLHVRPVLNMKDPGDVRTMRAVAEECFSLVRDYKGSHSGEHGDGIARSEFHARMFGDRIVRAFEVVKDSFDPEGLLNPNRIVRPPRFDDSSLFRTPPGYGPLKLTPKLDWSEHPGGLLGAAEMCNNNGTCRGFDAEVMCPSFRASRDERDVVRGRANTLRLALSGQLGAAGLAGDEVADALKLCVSCKACRRECPTGVDMARMKIEALAARAERGRLAPRDLAVAFLPRISPWAARMPRAANAAQLALARRLGFARTLPAWRGDFFRDDEAESGGAPPHPTLPHKGGGLSSPPPLVGGGREGGSPGREVILFADTFSRWFEPDNLRAALRVLRAAGLRPVLPRASGRPLCCGRTFLAVGLVERARAEAQRTLAALSGGAPVLGLEPSCLFTLRDEFPAMLPGPEARSLAARAMLLTEFLEREQIAPPLGELVATAHVHGHCHQKSFGAFPAALAALRRVPGLTVSPIASSCCGMAGAFGYQAETQDASRAMAEAALLPAVRSAAPDDLIVADGTSCRTQILSLGGRTAVHSVQVLARALTTP